MGFYRADFRPESPYALFRKNKTERRIRSVLFYMVEDKMKKMKNCYLQLLIYPKDVSY